MLSKVTGVYRLTRDVELKYLQSGAAVATLGLANSEKFKVNGEQRENTCFVDASIFGKLAEVANQYLRKSSQVYIVASLSFEQWVDQSGQKRSKHKLKVDSFEMIGSKNDSNSHSSPQQHQPQQSTPTYAYEGSNGQQMSPKQYNQQQQSCQQPAQQPMPSADAIPSIDVDTDEIPF